uniref:G-protein coupled receptors family 3 profile domain-containing protein n=1 Tax=Erpetoichthys calabaricus TaxID=27687 RepID=A0A8C4TKS2_ERPCA
MIAVTLVLLAVFVKAEDTICKMLQTQPDEPLFAKDGDIIIGGIFSFHNSIADEKPMFKEIFNIKEFLFAKTMAFAAEEINNNSNILPGISMGYKIYDDCSSVPLAMKAALALVNGLEKSVTNFSCTKPSNIYAIIGMSDSTPTIAVTTSIRSYHIPVISYYSTCACLSKKLDFPTFFRTIPSDYHQSKALAQLVKHFGWTWLGALSSDNDYGNAGIAAFIEAVQKEGLCVEYAHSIYRNSPREKVLTLVDIMKRASSKVIVVFATFSDLEDLIKELFLQNVTSLQWIGSEGWISSEYLATKENYSVLKGALGLAISNVIIPSLPDYLNDIRPSEIPKSIDLNMSWVSAFNCSLETEVLRNISCIEAPRQISNQYTDVPEVRIANNVYKAVYAIAHSLHSLFECQCNLTNDTCSDKIHFFILCKVLEKLKKVNYTTSYGENVYFDENGDPVAKYDLINWQMSEKGTIKFVNVGLYDSSLLAGKQFSMNNVSIMWRDGYNKVPKSVCSESCQPGTRKAVRKGKPICCFDCLICGEGEINSIFCLKCQLEYKSNEQRDQCILKDIEFLTFGEIMGILLVILSILGTMVTLTVATVFFKYRQTPVVKANNSELSFLLLFSLTFCFLCSLTFIGEPSDWSCMLRHTAFGITFVLCISCILGKTLVVLMAFRATLPGNNIMKLFGPRQQRFSVFSLTAIQILICALWLMLSPPFPIKNMQHYNDKIILECDLGSAVTFYSVLGYIGLLSIMCFILAFLARKLPDNFNEAKFITFSMLIFCSVWLAFIPAYISSPGKYTVAVEIFAILASSFGLLFCIFAPKCYIILLKPEKNTKKVLLGKNQPKALQAQGVLCPVLVSRLQKGHSSTGKIPEKSN